MLRVLIPLLTLALTVYAVIDCVQANEDDVRGLPKLFWVVLIVIAPIVGAAAWFFAGRPQRQRPRGGPRPAGPRGPDDDPDFLRGI